MAIQVTKDQMKDFEEIRYSAIPYKYISSIRAYVHVEENAVRIKSNSSSSFLLSLDTIKFLSSLNESDRTNELRKIVRRHFRTVAGRYIEYVIENGGIEQCH